jgi:hypothetical protein
VARHRRQLDLADAVEHALAAPGDERRHVQSQLMSAATLGRPFLLAVEGNPDVPDLFELLRDLKGEGSYMHAVPVVRKAFLSALAALALLAGALFVAAPKASASSCVANYVCIWDQITYNGAIHYYACSSLGTFSTPFGNPYRSAKSLWQ